MDTRETDNNGPHFQGNSLEREKKRNKSNKGCVLYWVLTECQALQYTVDVKYLIESSVKNSNLGIIIFPILKSKLLRL